VRWSRAQHEKTQKKTSPIHFLLQLFMTKISIFKFLSTFSIVCLGSVCVAADPKKPSAPTAAKVSPINTVVENQSEFLSPTARLETLPVLSDKQIEEFITDICLELEVLKGYKRTDASGLELPAYPDRISGGTTLVRKKAGGTDILRLGYLVAPRRLPQLWVYGVSQASKDSTPNADASAAILNPILKALLSDRSKLLARLPLSALRTRIINLSYTDAEAAMQGLRAMGFSAITDDMPLVESGTYTGDDVPLMKTPLQKNGVGMASSLGDAVLGSNSSMPTSNKNSPARNEPFESPGEGGAMPSGGFGGLSSMGSRTLGGGLSSVGGMGGQMSPRSARPSFRNIPSTVNFEQLPLVMRLPAPAVEDTGLVSVGGTQNHAAQGSGGGGLGGAGGGMFGGGSSSMFGNFGGGSSKDSNPTGLTESPSMASPLGATVASGTQQLMVLYHPDNLEQFTRVKNAIDNVIDKPARQVFVEGLVLEISKQGIQELGVQWQRTTGSSMLQLGSLTQLIPGQQVTANLAFDNAGKFDPKPFFAKINALVDRNKAEVLSRPSILTLDNRQASIRVGADVPIATSKDASSSLASGRVSFSFQYLPTGILLNVRPRLNEDASEISMVIDATVSASVPGMDLRVVDPSTGALLASAPTISQRRVQTYARIVNNTPLIIGGLVSKDVIKQEDKVPGLADVPFFGRLFGYEANTDNSREVIIVLTPSVLTEELRATKPQIPRDDDRFDSADTRLFRSAYRIRAEDLIDSQYIRFNQRLLTYRKIANQVIERNPDLANVEPFSNFKGTRVPGEFVFVSGMMSRMLDRLKVAEPINIDRLSYFEGVVGASFKKDNVGSLLKRLGDGKTHASFFEKNPGKALTIKFRNTRASLVAGDWATEPVAEIQMVDCANRDAWRHLLWELNQPVNGVQTHHTVVLHQPEDLDRLKLAVALKNTILNNGNEVGTVFDNFLPGRMLAMQEVAPEWERILEASVGRYFYFSELFYPAFFETLERSISSLDSRLRQPDMAPYIKGIQLPELKSPTQGTEVAK
jgi:general secretion pathway protein D